MEAWLLKTLSSYRETSQGYLHASYAPFKVHPILLPEADLLSAGRVSSHYTRSLGEN